MKYFVTVLILFISISVFAQDTTNYAGKVISQINIKTSRISPKIVQKNFPLSQGEVFYSDNYDFARQKLHDMRIFKTIDFNITQNKDNTLTIDIDANDAYYVFPLVVGGGDGKNSMISAALIETNFFKVGEFALISGTFLPDGYISMLGFGMNDIFANIMFGKITTDELVYKNGSYRVLDKSEDKSIPVSQYTVETIPIRLSIRKSFFKKASVSLGFEHSEVSYTNTDIEFDGGIHNKMILGLGYLENMRSAGGAMGGLGAFFGIGLSDVGDRLATLPKAKFGYSLNLNYENGGNYIGSDYLISKLYTRAATNVEFRKRHVWAFTLDTAKAFKASYYDRIRSAEVLNSGRYTREFRGQEALGVGTSFTYFLFKNKKGITTFTPFIESALVWDRATAKDTTGVGASIAYRFWRIPFPLGLKYTQNVVDGSYDISFMFGG